MAFPQVQDSDTQSGVQASDSATWTLTYPTNIGVNDLILAFMAVDGNVNVPTFPVNWGVGDRDLSGTAVACTIAKKKALGTESGNFTVTHTAAEQGCWIVLRIVGWEGTLGTGFGNGVSGGAVMRIATSGTSAAPDPSALNPTTWDIEDTLWLIIGASNGGDTVYSGFPANYTNGSAQASGGANGAALGTARREFATASENPGAFTTDVSAEWVTETIAIRPGNAGLPVVTANFAPVIYGHGAC